jgi:hypothetical protein
MVEFMESTVTPGPEGHNGGGEQNFVIIRAVHGSFAGHE